MLLEPEIAGITDHIWTLRELLSQVADSGLVTDILNGPLINVTLTKTALSKINPKVPAIANIHLIAFHNKDSVF